MKKIEGKITTTIGGKTRETKYVRETEEQVGDYTRRGLTENELDNWLKELISKKETLLSKENFDIKEAKNWVSSYRNYILEKYGEDSEQFIIYKKTNFNIGTVLTSPNVYLLAWRQTMRKAMEKSVKYILGDDLDERNED